jgi:hypothetical protein
MGLGPSQHPIQLMQGLRMARDETDHSIFVLRLRMRGAVLHGHHHHHHHHPSRVRPWKTYFGLMLCLNSMCLRGMVLNKAKWPLCFVSLDLTPAEFGTAGSSPGQSAGSSITRWAMALLLIFLTCNHAGPLLATACDIGRVAVRLFRDEIWIQESWPEYRYVFYIEFPTAFLALY